ncbi:MAG: ABC transporter ATP-binding protein [Pseudomonadota bacterium]
MTLTAPLITVQDLCVEFRLSRTAAVHAVSGVSFHIDSGQTLGLVGESGCGKTTVARTIVNLQAATAGRILFDGEDLLECSARRLREIRPDIQMIFQDAAGALNPGRTVGKTVAEPLRVLGRADRRARHEAARSLMYEVGIDPDNAFNRRSFEFSLGQCQRIGIARALITNPRLLICDEPVSALDVSVQAQILNLLRKIKTYRCLTMLFISHDLAVIKNICDRVAVMYMGRICETADVESLYRSPRHPYTSALLAAVPSPDPDRTLAKRSAATNGAPPSPIAPPPGCRYHTRCDRARDRCRALVPSLTEHEPQRQVACHYPLSS